MKKLIIISGTMGVGKSTTCDKLFKQLDKSVYLDGDCCWNMNPFIVNEENKNMVINNITYLLRSYLKNSSFEYIIFSWVLHEQSIFKQILDPLSDLDFTLYNISLICSPKALKDRLNKDVELGIRNEEIINRSIERIPLYNKLDTIKIDTTLLSLDQTANEIIKIIS